MVVLAVTSMATISLGALYFYQRSIIYPSTLNSARSGTDSPSRYNLPFEEIYLTTPDKVKLHSYFLKHSNQIIENKFRKTIVILSPNAGNIGHFLPVVNYIFNLGHNVFIYQYRGYGQSTGEPTEDGLKIDAETAMNYLINDETIKNSPLILYGRSLGGAITLFIANKFGFLQNDRKLGFIIENTFLDIPRVVPHIFPLLGWLGENILSKLISDRWWSEIEIVKIRDDIPGLFLSGTLDEVVPPLHMKKLFDLKKGLKVWREFQSHHNDTIVQDGYWDTWEQFVDSYV